MLVKLHSLAYEVQSFPDLMLFKKNWWLSEQSKSMMVILWIIPKNWHKDTVDRENQMTNELRYDKHAIANDVACDIRIIEKRKKKNKY